MSNFPSNEDSQILIGQILPVIISNALMIERLRLDVAELDEDISNIESVGIIPSEHFFGSKKYMCFPALTAPANINLLQYPSTPLQLSQLLHHTPQGDNALKFEHGPNADIGKNKSAAVLVDPSKASMHNDTVAYLTYRMFACFQIVHPEEPTPEAAIDYNERTFALGFQAPSWSPTTEMSNCPQGPHGFPIFYDIHNRPILGTHDIDGMVIPHNEESIKAFFYTCPAIEIQGEGSEDKILSELEESGHFPSEAKPRTVLKFNAIPAELPIDLSDRIMRMAIVDPKHQHKLILTWGLSTVATNMSDTDRDFRDARHCFHNFNNQHPERALGKYYRYYTDEIHVRRPVEEYIFSPLSFNTPANEKLHEHGESQSNMHLSSKAMNLPDTKPFFPSRPHSALLKTALGRNMFVQERFEREDDEKFYALAAMTTRSSIQNNIVTTTDAYDQQLIDQLSRPQATQPRAIPIVARATANDSIIFDNATPMAIANSPSQALVPWSQASTASVDYSTTSDEAELTRQQIRYSNFQNDFRKSQLQIAAFPHLK
jgi:hypothetical protein